MLRRIVRAVRRRIVAPAPVWTEVPGRGPIRLVAYYEELAGYYPNCELKTKRWFVENAGRDWVYLDCGANVGYYALLFSELSPEGHVYAFEPTATHAMLLANLRDNAAGNVVAERLALGRASGTAEATLQRLWGHATERGAFPFTTVDDYVRERGIGRVDCIKVDVDSYDFDVLQGAQATLERFDPWIVVELTDLALTLRGQFTTEVLRWLAARGYGEGRVLEEANYLFRRRGLGDSGGDGPRLTLRFES
jgi:FkbM family methyltransferase